MIWADFIREVSPFLLHCSHETYLKENTNLIISVFSALQPPDDILPYYQIGIIERLIGICCILNLSDICKKQQGNDCLYQIPH